MNPVWPAKKRFDDIGPDRRILKENVQIFDTDGKVIL